LQGKKLPVLKGHVTGGVSFAMNVNDREDRMLAYDENFFDMSVKAMTAKGLWQVKTLSPFTDELILFYDEPALVGFGSAFIQVTQEQITEALRYTVDQIQATGTKIGIHCCANTDWSLILNARPNILSFDAFSFFDNILVYADPLRGYLKAGGKIAFGIVPTNEVAYARTPEQLLERIIEQIDQISDLGIDRDMIVHHTLISPACGLGTTHNELAEQALGLAGDVADAFCDHYDI
jgi:methionine synthase II (cobalamin-independent)